MFLSAMNDTGAHVGLSSAPSVPSLLYEIPQWKDQLLIRGGHALLHELGGSNPLHSLPVFPCRVTQPSRAGGEKEYNVSITGMGTKVGIAKHHAFHFTTQRSQWRLATLDCSAWELPESRFPEGRCDINTFGTARLPPPTSEDHDQAGVRQCPLGEDRLPTKRPFRPKCFADM